MPSVGGFFFGLNWLVNLELYCLLHQETGKLIIEGIAFII